MDTEHQVARHYTHGSLEAAVLDALKAGGKDIENLVPGDLSGADEFHLGWHAATIELAKDLRLAPDDHVLDVGSGIGGPARYFADAHGCRVTGIDLTQEFVDVANALTRRCRLGKKVAFRQASALELPFEAGQFDATTLIHVGMNIADKGTLFSEVRRVLKKGGRFGVYDIMRMDEGAITYPVPWAASSETSFVETPDTYRRLLTAVGFAIEQEQNRREFSLRLAREMRENAAKHGSPPLGPHVLMGPAAKDRLANVFAVLEGGTIAPIEMIARSL